MKIKLVLNESWKNDFDQLARNKAVAAIDATPLTHKGGFKDEEEYYDYLDSQGTRPSREPKRPSPILTHKISPRYLNKLSIEDIIQFAQELMSEARPFSMNVKDYNIANDNARIISKRLKTDGHELGEKLNKWRRTGSMRAKSLELKRIKNEKLKEKLAQAQDNLINIHAQWRGQRRSWHLEDIKKAEELIKSIKDEMNK